MSGSGRGGSHGAEGQPPVAGPAGCPAPLMAALIPAGSVPSPRRRRRRARAWVSAPYRVRGAGCRGVGGRAGAGC